MGGTPIMVMNQQVQRETGRKAQMSNIAAGKAVSEIIRTTLGPRSMLKVCAAPAPARGGGRAGPALTRQTSAPVLSCRCSSTQWAGS